MQKLQLAAGVAHGGVGADEFADAGAIDVIHVVEAQQDFLVATLSQVANGFAQRGAALTEGDLAAEVHDGYVANLAAGALECHGFLSRLFYSAWCFPLPETA